MGPAQAQELGSREGNRKPVGRSPDPTAPQAAAPEASPQAPAPASAEQKSALSSDEEQEFDFVLKAVAAPISAYLAVNRVLRSIIGQAANLLVGSSPQLAQSASNPTNPSTTNQSPPPPLNSSGNTPQSVARGFAGPKSMQTWQNQMNKRGWTAQQIEDAIQTGDKYPADNRVNPGNGATRYENRDTGRSVVIDDTTGQVIQLGGDRFK